MARRLYLRVVPLSQRPRAAAQQREQGRQQQAGRAENQQQDEQFAAQAEGLRQRLLQRVNRWHHAEGVGQAHGRQQDDQ